MHQASATNPQQPSASTGFWLKLGDAAHALGVSEITLRRKVKCNRLAHDFRNGKYFVFLHKDEATGQFYEPGQFEDPFAFSKGGSGATLSGLREHAPARSGTLPSLSLRETRPPLVSEIERRDLQNRVLALETALTEKDAHAQSLRRALEDQATLIAFLEETIETLGHKNAGTAQPAQRTQR